MLGWHKGRGKWHPATYEMVYGAVNIHTKLQLTSVAVRFSLTIDPCRFWFSFLVFRFSLTIDPCRSRFSFRLTPVALDSRRLLGRLTPVVLRFSFNSRSILVCSRVNNGGVLKFPPCYCDMDRYFRHDWPLSLFDSRLILVAILF